MVEEEGREEEEEEDGVMALGLVVRLVVVRLEGAEEAEGVVRLVAEIEENVTDLVGRDLVDLVALVRLYPVKVAEGETSEVEVEVRVPRREREGGMLANDRCDEKQMDDEK